MPTDDEFADVFARALRGAAELAPEPVRHAALAPLAEQRGRRWRRRRRTALGGALAAVVLAGAGGFAVVGRGPFAGGPAGPPEPVLPRMTTEEVLGTITGMLPHGGVRVVTSGGAGDPGQHRTGATILFDDGAGESILTITAERTDRPPAETANCMDGFVVPQDSCDRVVRPDGSVLTIDKLRDRTEADKREWRATWAAPDGRRVEVTEFNGQPAAASRPNPPLSAEQLTALVTGEGWERVFASLAPAPGGPPSAASPAPTAAQGPSGEELLGRLVPLLPSGAAVSGRDAGRGVLTATVDGRTSMLMVAVDPPSQRGREDLRGAERSPATPLEVRDKRRDGTLVVTNRFGNGKGATDPVLHWTATVYYPDGRQVRISEWNGENGYTFRPGDPALEVDALKAIATDPVWRS
ncbi:hypothetical protein ACIRS1_19115 [Kitasatospora sp. NPDC101176]|uniref:hypothetical protein n=1 Tax=Kitasatospora sp. NPDC101176 TaxID=3364099 RepID=UPI003803121F